jgi:hypothetical protein
MKSPLGWVFRRGNGAAIPKSRPFRRIALCSVAGVDAISESRVLSALRHADVTGGAAFSRTRGERRFPGNALPETKRPASNLEPFFPDFHTLWKAKGSERYSQVLGNPPLASRSCSNSTELSKNDIRWGELTHCYPKNETSTASHFHGAISIKSSDSSVLEEPHWGCDISTGIFHCWRQIWYLFWSTFTFLFCRWIRCSLALAEGTCIL